MLTCAYADPPYIGHARRLYGCAEIDHAALLEVLMRDYSDGWALSLSSNSLRHVLPLCPDKARVMAWCKKWIPFKKNVNPSYAWEPVIVYGGRKRPPAHDFMPDWLVGSSQQQIGFVGAKPYEFCVWLFRALGLKPGDTLADLFPGTGRVGKAWSAYCAQVDLRFG